MKKVFALLAIVMLPASMSYAVDFQGEVIKVEGAHITVEVFGDAAPTFNAGAHVNVVPVRKGAPTLDMLKG